MVSQFMPYKNSVSNLALRVAMLYWLKTLMPALSNSAAVTPEPSILVPLKVPS
ncbi:hypothetical protein VIBNISFn118_1270020 [Vibrio nigripulchritudo SFn118]|nr:hypothetical protein VIBNISFn118_1270020 [Vibrio nigripulchritudo SFn118]